MILLCYWSAALKTSVRLSVLCSIASILLKTCFGPTKGQKQVTDLIDLSRHIKIDPSIRPAICFRYIFVADLSETRSKTVETMLHTWFSTGFEQDRSNGIWASIVVEFFSNGR